MDRPATRDLRVTASSSTGISAQIRDAKGLALELKSILKRREPWDRDLEFQRESLRKAYLRIIFSPALAQPGATALQHRGSSTADALSTLGSTALKARSSTLGPASSTSSSSSAARQQLDILNLLWLDTSHALIQSYRSRLATLDKQLASAPKAHKGASKSRNQHGNGGDVQSAAVGPVARRKLVHAFRQFLSREDDFWRTLCGRLASLLSAEEALDLRAVGIVQSDFLSASDGFGDGAAGERGDSFGPAATSGADGRAPAQADLSDDERRVRRAAVLPLAHKALICYGDLARYAELYNEASVPAAVAAGGNGGGARREGGRRGGKGGRGAAMAAAAADKRVKTYSKAAECYNQARMLLPDNGNPSNQLAVLAQYCADPLSSVYHYYRALSVRTPFSTARANLQITFAKAIARWFSSEGGEPEGDEGVKFRAAFVVLQGILYTKDKLSELPTLSLRVEELFRVVLVDRIFTSDVVTKIVVTALSALWDARISRSSSTTLSRSKTGSTAPPLASATATTSPGEPAPASRVNLEPEALVHLLSLFSLLLRVSATETIELFSTNANTLSTTTTSSTTAPAAANPAQNISAVLRRSLPALRILTKWLIAQLDYVERVTLRLEAAERKRLARARARGRTSTGTSGPGGGSGGSADDGEGEQHEAQQPLSLDSSASRGSGATPGAAAGRATLAELEAALDALWAAYADYANAVKLAFPAAALGDAQALLADGGWLEEDVELLGFAPLRRAMRPADGEAADTAGARIRRVGRDVHPNDEQLMRVVEGQQDALVLAESPLARMSLIDGAYVFTPREHANEDTSFDQPEPAAAARPQEDDADEDEEMLDQGTEDDPVDRAMRIDAADKLDMDGLSDLDDDLDDDDDDDDDEEQIVYPGSGSRSSPQPHAKLPAPGVSRSSSHYSTPSASPARVPGALRQQLFHGGVPPLHQHHTPPAAPPVLKPSSSYTSPSAAGPSLLGPAPGGSPSLNSMHSIWSTAPGLGGSPLLPPTSTLGALPPPSSFALAQQQPQQQQQSVTPRSFESIPNLTHGSQAAQLAGWPASAPGAQHGALPPPAASGGALYGGAFSAPLAHAATQGGGAPTAYPHAHQHEPPTSTSSRPPGFPTAFAGQVQPQQQQWASTAVPPGLSPYASPFGQAPPPPQGQGGGWPSGYS
ncbi:hypothetical protein JCM3775_001242 [Rhodotorula graminis]